MYYNDIIAQVSKDIGLPSNVVDKVYKLYWKFIRETILRLPIKDNISKEEFSKLRTNFNIPSLGKLSCTYDRVKGVKERYKYIRSLREKK